MKIKITGIIIMVIFAGTLIFYTCGKSQPQTDNQIYIGVACYDQKDTFIEELVDAFKEQCSSMESKDYAISMTIMDASNSQRVQNDQIEQMINDGCNVLCVNLADRTEPSEIIDAAKEKGANAINSSSLHAKALKQILRDAAAPRVIYRLFFAKLVPNLLLIEFAIASLTLSSP